MTQNDSMTVHVACMSCPRNPLHACTYTYTHTDKNVHPLTPVCAALPQEEIELRSWPYLTHGKHHWFSMKHETSILKLLLIHSVSLAVCFPSERYSPDLTANVEFSCQSCIWHNNISFYICLRKFTLKAEMSHFFLDHLRFQIFGDWLLVTVLIQWQLTHTS